MLKKENKMSFTYNTSNINTSNINTSNINTRRGEFRFHKKDNKKEERKEELDENGKWKRTAYTFVEPPKKEEIVNKNYDGIIDSNSFYAKRILGSSGLHSEPAAFVEQKSSLLATERSGVIIVTHGSLSGEKSSEIDDELEIKRLVENNENNNNNNKNNNKRKSLPTPEDCNENTDRIIENILYISFNSDNMELRKDFYWENHGGDIILDFNKVLMDDDVKMLNQMKNFGCFSNSIDSKVFKMEHGIIYNFCTKYSVPFRYYEKLSKKYPNYNFYTKARDLKYKLNYTDMVYSNGQKYIDLR